MADTGFDSNQEARKVIDEVHVYMRHTIQLWVQWFTFFLTVNYVALGWFAGEIATGNLKNTSPLVRVAVLFICQDVLGIGICFAVRRWIQN